MLKSEKNSGSNTQSVERRAYPRIPIRSLAYLELDDDNAGLILNVSEGGIGVQSAEMITGDRFDRMILRLPKLEKWIEATGKLAWISPSRKEAGIQFVDLSDDARQQIQNWIYSSSLRPGVPVDQGHFKIVWESREPEISPVLPAPKDDLADIDAMFPSEKVVPPTRHARVDHDSTVAASPTSSIELGIAPGPVKRGVAPSPAEAAISEQIAGANLAPSPQTQAAIEPPAAVRRSYHYPPLSLDSKASGDPFASIAQETSAVVPSASAVFQARQADPPAHAATALNEPIAPAFPIREHYRGLGYNPAPFEEPSGKGWLIAAAILIIVLGGGAVMALGPSNVKAILSQHLQSISGGAPRPPAGATDKSSEPAAASTSRDSADSASFGGTPQGPLTNPGVTASHETDTPAAQAPPQVEAPPTITTVTGKPASPASPASESRAADTVPQVLDTGGAVAPGESAEDVEAMTRRFQMEHSGSNPRNVTNSVGATSLPSPAHETPLSVPPSASNPGASASQASPPHTFDNYSQPSSPTPATSNSMNSNVSSAGTVAVSSHFRSLRGEDPGATQERQGLNVGQLISIHQPAYPVEAERSRTEGTVQLRATVDQLGKVEIVHAVSGPPLLLAAAVDAVREWRYAPTTLDGKAVESVNDVNVVFRLGNSAASPR